MVAYLTNRRGIGGGTSQTMEAIQDGVPAAVNLAQIGGGGNGGKDKKKLKQIQCKSCKGWGHVAKDCPSEYQDGTKAKSDESSVTSQTSKSGKPARVGWSGFQTEVECYAWAAG